LKIVFQFLQEMLILHISSSSDPQKITIS